MKKLNLLLAILMVHVLAKAATVVVSGNITTNTNWVNTNIYVLTGEVYVKNNATLTIQEGTIIQGDMNSTRPCLIITKGAKINAVGTPTNPIVFTSNQAPGSRKPGDWGGILLLGKAPVNDPAGFKTIEGLPASTDCEYGGTDIADSSGVMKYVRIEFAGIAFAPNQEINGLTFSGVGNKTVIENIQVSYSGDDAFEWFGGSVNCKNLVAYYNLDDDFDTDNGFSGNLQFGVGFRHPDIADVSGSNGFESDNDAGGTYNNPRTMCTFSNFTLVGPKATLTSTVNSNFKRGAHLRRSTLLSVFNTIYMGWPIGLYIDGSNCEKSAMNDSMFYLNNIIAGCNTPLIASSGGSIDSITGMETFFTTKATGSIRYVNANDTVQLTNPFDTTAAINPMPKAGSPVLSGASFTNPKLASFQNVSFRGAFGTTNWMDSWTSFSPKTNVYKEKTAAVENTNNQYAVEIYPNPVTSYANVYITNTNPQSIKVQLTDITGKTISSKEVQTEVGTTAVSMDVNLLKAGVYFLSINGAQGSHVQRIQINQ